MQQKSIHGKRICIKNASYNIAIYSNLKKLNCFPNLVEICRQTESDESKTEYQLATPQIFE